MSNEEEIAALQKLFAKRSQDPEIAFLNSLFGKDDQQTALQIEILIVALNEKYTDPEAYF